MILYDRNINSLHYSVEKQCIDDETGQYHQESHYLKHYTLCGRTHAHRNIQLELREKTEIETLPNR